MVYNGIIEKEEVKHRETLMFHEIKKSFINKNMTTKINYKKLVLRSVKKQIQEFFENYNEYAVISEKDIILNQNGNLLQFDSKVYIIKDSYNLITCVASGCIHDNCKIYLSCIKYNDKYYIAYDNEHEEFFELINK